MLNKTKIDTCVDLGSVKSSDTFWRLQQCKIDVTKTVSMNTIAQSYTDSTFLFYCSCATDTFYLVLSFVMLG